MLAMTGQEELNLLASELRIKLDCPSGWVEVFADEFIGPHVGIAIEVSFEETGDAESGPHLSMDVQRFLQVHRIGRDTWRVDLKDNTLMDSETYDPVMWEKDSHVASFEFNREGNPRGDAETLKQILTFLGTQFKEA